MIPLALLAEAANPAAGMQPSAWAFMLAVWSVIIGFTAWCFYKVLSSPRRLDDGDPEPPPAPESSQEAS
jgi:hypothetical protein